MIAPDDSGFTVRVETIGDAVRVTVAGDVDLATAAMFRDGLARAAAQAEAAVVVDLEGVTYLDSTGINCLLDAAELARTRGVAIRVEHTQPPVERVLRIAGIADVIEIVPPD